MAKPGKGVDLERVATVQTPRLKSLSWALGRGIPEMGVDGSGGTLLM
jgi:hypothetical protein